jgi:hypothetical protein
MMMTFQFNSKSSASNQAIKLHNRLYIVPLDSTFISHTFNMVQFVNFVDKYTMSL